MSELINLDSLFAETQTGVGANILLREELTAHRQFPGAWPAVTTAIVRDTLAPTRAYTVVETEGGAETDILGLINPVNVHDGMELKLVSQDSRIITVRHQPTAANGITLAGGADIILSTSRFLFLKRFGDRWREIVTESIPFSTDARLIAGNTRETVTAAQLAALIARMIAAEAAIAAIDPVLPGSIISFSGTFGGANNKFPINPKNGVPDLSHALCDGGTYTSPDGRSVTTPNLVDRFIKGSTPANAKQTGGGATVSGGTTLTIAQMPWHEHTYTTRGQIGGLSGAAGGWAQVNMDSSTQGTGGAGGNQAHTHPIDVTPPYYTSAYIIKL